ncbi:MAG: HEAT repeat domain-containing protein [Candidatus Aminicenantales bacterium]
MDKDEEIKTKNNVNGETCEELLGKLNSPDSYVRSSAAWALGELRDKRALKALIKALHDRSPDVRWSAALALGEIMDKRALDALYMATKDRNIDVRKIAREAMQKIRETNGLQKGSLDHKQ